jgi:lactoylglutathione lyase
MNGQEVNMFTFNHFNFNVKDLETSLKWYREALGLEPVLVKDKEDFTLVYLGDGKTGFRLELTYLKNRTEPYDLGEQEFHLAMTAEDMEAAHKKHQEMGAICFENPSMGIYFLEDPDGYWIEIVPDGEYMAEHTR